MRTLRRIFFFLSLAVVVLVVLGIGSMMSMFASMKRVEDGQELEGFARTVKDGMSNVFVLDAGKGTVALIDAGLDPGAHLVTAELARRSLSTDAVAAIFFTHGHGDHIGACKAFPRAKSYAMAREVDLIEGRSASIGPITRFLGKNAAGCKVTQALTDGEVVRVGALAVRAFAVPGHTPGSGAYLVKGVLFLGDSADGAKDDKLQPAKWVFTDDAATNAASLTDLARRVNARDVKMLAFGHSGPVPASALWAFAAGR